jgi:hypothetical protein
LAAEESAEGGAVENHQLDEQPAHFCILGGRGFGPVIAALAH